MDDFVQKNVHKMQTRALYLSLRCDKATKIKIALNTLQHRDDRNAKRKQNKKNVSCRREREKDTKQKKNVETDCGRLFFTDIQNIHKYINIYTYI